MTVVDAVAVATNSKKPNNGSTLINIVLDETGSMNSCWDATIASFNDYIGSQKTVGGDCRVTLTTFSTSGNFGPTVFGAAVRSINMTQVMQEARDTGLSVRTVFENAPVETVSPLTRESYRPNGGTNLYDAIGTTIRKVEAQLAPEATVPNVLIVIITDGEENASVEYGLNDIQSLIRAKEQEGWTFVYLGANQDAWRVGATFGLAASQTMTYSTSNMSGTMETLSAATARYRGARMADASLQGVAAKGFFNDDETNIAK